MRQKSSETYFYKVAVLVGAAAFLLWELAGCRPASEGDLWPGADSAGSAVSVVCTTFPQYDWVRQLTKGCENGYQLKLLLDKGTDMHSYQPTAADMMAVAECDVFIYVGGESDLWVKDAPEAAGRKERRELSLMEALGDAVMEEETVEGMENSFFSGHKEDVELDEHVWLSLRNARVLVKEIARVLETADEAYAERIAENAAAYDARLAELDRQYADAVAAATDKTLLFGDRFPFRYLTEDYGLVYYAAFPGCSAETEASFGTIAFLAEKTKKLDLAAVLMLENSDTSVAQAIINNSGRTDREILALHSIQSVSTEDMAAGTTYLSLMEDNLAVLKKALH